MDWNAVSLQFQFNGKNGQSITTMKEHRAS